MALPQAPLINGKAWGWVDLEASILGRSLVGVNSLEYSVSSETEEVMGAGKFPVAYGEKAETYSGSIELLMEEIVALRRVAPGNNLTTLPPFQIIARYSTNAGTKVTKDVITCQITEDKGGMAQGESHKYHTLNLKVYSIEFDV